MNKLKVRYLFYLVISCILFSCAAKEVKNENDESLNSNENKSEILFKNSKNKKAKTKSIRDAEPFYPIDESVEVLSELKEKGVLLYILSNWSAETYPIAEERFDFLSWFDGKIISGEAGIVKPDLEIYKLLIKKYELNPQKTVFIDDKEENIKSAELLGFNGIHFQNCSKLRKDLQMLKLL